MVGLGRISKILFSPVGTAVAIAGGFGKPVDLQSEGPQNIKLPAEGQAFVLS